MDIRQLKKEYEERKSSIKRRLKDFEDLKKSKENLLIELCFCICTPLSKAERVFLVINDKNKGLLLNGSVKDISKALKGHARFHNNKARYIAEAREKMHLLENLPKVGIEARDFIISNFKGLGMKEAAHFLRNIGYKEMVILDGHIINSLHELKAIGSNARPKSRKHYEELSEKFRDFSRKVCIPLDELDLLFWSSKTGKVLK